GNQVGGTFAQDVASRNFISANDAFGIDAADNSENEQPADNTIVQANFIGIDGLGNPAGNTLSGIRVTGSNDTIAGNLIVANGADGVYVTALAAGDNPTNTIIRANQIGLIPGNTLPK